MGYKAVNRSSQYLVHFNKNHSKANGQFTSGDGDGDGIVDDHSNQGRIKGQVIDKKLKLGQRISLNYVRGKAGFDKGSDYKRGDKITVEEAKKLLSIADKLIKDSEKTDMFGRVKGSIEDRNNKDAKYEITKLLSSVDESYADDVLKAYKDLKISENATQRKLTAEQQLSFMVNQKMFGPLV